MFKSFTWLKLAGWLGIAASLITSPLVAGLLPLALAAKLGALAVTLTGISSFITTSKAGTATNAAGAQLNGNAPPGQ